MSAIYGAIDLSGKCISDEIKRVLRAGFDDCVIDRFEEKSDKNYFLGCGIQYFTKEAVREQLPICNDESAFTADVMIDNREELIYKYKLTSKEYTDGDILYQVHRIKGLKSVNDPIGAYCYVNYKIDTNEVEIVSDAVGYRFVYYLIQNQVVYFSSLMKPLEKIIHSVKPNHRWISDYIGQDNLNIFTEAEETPIIGINRIAPGSYMVISEKGIYKKRYWDPYRNSKKVRLKNDDEYKAKFLGIYTEAVFCLLRANGETAMMLSGGYDSTSVATIAEPILKRRGQKLYAFTSVPFEGYISDVGENMIADETELVKKTCEIYDGIECDYMHMPEMNGWYDRKMYREIAEIPYKSPQNMLWMFESMKRAREKNARVILMGAFGNGTVSFDNTENYFVWLFQRLKWYRLYQEINAIHEKAHYTRKSVWKTTIAAALGRRNEKFDFNGFIGNSFCKMQYLKEQKADDRIKKTYGRYEKVANHYKKYQEAFLSVDVLRHYGEFSQKNSLYTGVIMRDPTRDKRMIEFTVGLPYDQFTHDGIQRRLISEYMKDMIPDHIFNCKKIGRQSADLKARLCKKEDIIVAEWRKILSDNINHEIVDCELLLRGLDENNFQEFTDFQLVRYIFTIALLEYINTKF